MHRPRPLRLRVDKRAAVADGAALISSSLIMIACAVALDEGLPKLAAARAVFARRVNKFSSLTGAWSGAYAYPSGYGAPAVPFNARIEETGDCFTGDIDEPNTYADPSAPRLFASISGTRKGLDVSFVKKMDGTGGASHAIYYEGAANADLSRIDGKWRLPDGFSGTFFMERAGVEAEAAVSRTASATG